MTKKITFNELRQVKDNLPEGATSQIAEKLGLTIETVRNYFGGYNYKKGQSCGVHIEKGPYGGLVMLDDPTILDLALKITNDFKKNNIKQGV